LPHRGEVHVLQQHRFLVQPLLDVLVDLRTIGRVIQHDHHRGWPGEFWTKLRPGSGCAEEGFEIRDSHQSTTIAGE